ncbi:DUF1624 domain-containing protein [Sediminibacterium roseum]|uniref:DUF1624 domain-containing protein n=1 Tax=Sediminibacterium roseum TaxID=1978412 RepID=A0ABW9ZWD0_9BACT|nr:heparan-alpha-glucosaminide N-acetyltransferase domain-containing protein [Sediminibacterium roseum]NCI50835.1 DUF1624 domain-containing protein [Sediminibacterium roseum]
MEQAVLPSKKRIDSIDILRGSIMIIMALDHVRDFFHVGAMTGNPTDPATTTPALFFTRWITHFCAPVFVFLAGTSVFLAGIKKTKKELSVFLLKRGIWFIVLEIVIFNFLFSFDPLYHFIGLQVIWVTAISMLLLAALIYLPLPVLFVLGLAIVAGHNLLDNFNSTDPAKIPLGWSILHQQSFRFYAENRSFMVLYPILPWPGIMLLGYCLGSLYKPGYDAAKRRRKLIAYGLSAIVVFVVVRWINVYGDLFPWAEQKTTTATLLSFLNVSKYPPSLLYTCMTIGPALIVLAWIEKARKNWMNITVVYGRVPMFYYLLHFLLIHLLCMIVFFAQGYTMAEAGSGFMLFRPNEFGFSLGITYLIWIAVVASLYPLCKWYGRYRATHDHWWLPYL